MKKALKIGIMGMIGFMLFVYGGLNGYCLAWSRLYDRGNYIGADGLSYIARYTFKPVSRYPVKNTGMLTGRNSSAGRPQRWRWSTRCSLCLNGKVSGTCRFSTQKTG